jgi:hypothetical protein
MTQAAQSAGIAREAFLATDRTVALLTCLLDSAESALRTKASAFFIASLSGFAGAFFFISVLLVQLLESRPYQ